MTSKLPDSFIAAQAMSIMKNSLLFASRFPKPLTRWQRLVRWIKREKAQEMPLPGWLTEFSADGKSINITPPETIKIKLPPRYSAKTSAGENP